MCSVRSYLLVIFFFSEMPEEKLCLCTFDKTTHRLLSPLCGTVFRDKDVVTQQTCGSEYSK